jgi:hypothetical protein
MGIYITSQNPYNRLKNYEILRIENVKERIKFTLIVPMIFQISDPHIWG